MDPVSVIVSALVVGIAGVAKVAVNDAYQGLKTVIQDKYKIYLDGLEKKPDSKMQQEALKEQLADAQADTDAEIIEKANVVVEAVKKDAPEIPQTVGVNLVNVEAGIATFRNIRAHGGIGVNVKDSKFDKLEFGDVDAGTDPKNG